MLAIAGATVAPAFAGDFECVIEPRRIVEVKAPVEGLIERILVDRGDVVKANQVLVEIDSGLERASADLAKYRATMEGAVKAGQSRVEFTTRKLERKEELVSLKFVSPQDRDETATEKRLAEAELMEAQDNRRVSELEYRRAMEAVRLRTLRSPFDGIVIDRSAHPGEVARADDTRKPLLKLAQLDVLHVEAVLPVQAYGAVRLGMALEVMPEAPIGGTYSARIRVIDKVLDAPSGTFGVRLELPNPGLKLPAGVRCRVRLPGVDGARK
jgi:RND family efflux transporter MFP subunit